MSPQASSATDHIIDHAARLRSTASAAVEDEKREQPRQPYTASASLMLLGSGGMPGAPGQPMVVRALDLSRGGIRVESPKMIHPGVTGIVQLERSDGNRILVGVRICHCVYVRAMCHHVGMRFIPLPPEFHGKSFAVKR